MVVVETSTVVVGAVDGVTVAVVVVSGVGGAVAGVLPAAVHAAATIADATTIEVLRYRMYFDPTERTRHLKGHGNKVFPLPVR